MSGLRIDICICTFQRPFIAQTLQSLAALQIDTGWHVHVIVVDNDDTPSAKELVERCFQSLPFPGQYFHAPARNISLARNACLAQASAPLVAFIDDDEVVQPQWLSALVTVQMRENASAVLGPVNAIYPPAAPAWMVRADFHATRPVWVKDKIITGYSCNLLLNRADPALAALTFRLDLGNSGGEDTVFLSTIHARGGTIAYAPEAVVEEPVTPPRLQFEWLLKRRFRSGQTHGLLLQEKNGTSLKANIKQIVIAAAKAVYCALRALLSFNRARYGQWILRGALHAGVVAKLLGQNEQQYYG